ncbi:MAG TPA: 30S ribosomal protein S8 [bacterium]|nr:30S ribosomal protein S8 [bacterium]
MVMTDPIADLITRVRNAVRSLKTTVDVPFSKLKWSIAHVLYTEGYINGYDQRYVGDQLMIRIYLKYINEKQPLISDLTRVSTPGRRRYVKKDAIPYVLSGLGSGVISTSKGVMSLNEARKAGVGGEVLFTLH